MEKEKSSNSEINGKKNNSTKIIIVVLSVLLIGALGFICYDKFINKEKSPVPPSTSISTPAPSTTTNSTDSDSLYKLFSDNLKKKILNWSLRSYLAEDGIFYNDNKEVSYKIILTNKMELIMVFDDEEYKSKYGEIMLAKDVISFKTAMSGPGGYENIYFINSDGTVGEAIPWEIDSKNKKVPVTKHISNLKNIVSIVQVSYQELGYMKEPAAIDIDGNLIEMPMNAWD